MFYHYTVIKIRAMCYSNHTRSFIEHGRTIMLFIMKISWLFSKRYQTSSWKNIKSSNYVATKRIKHDRFCLKRQFLNIALAFPKHRASPRPCTRSLWWLNNDNSEDFNNSLGLFVRAAWLAWGAPHAMFWPLAWTQLTFFRCRKCVKQLIFSADLGNNGRIVHLCTTLHLLRATFLLLGRPKTQTKFQNTQHGWA